MNIYSPRRKTWSEDFRLQRITFPLPVPEAHAYHRKKFKITIFYTKKGDPKKQYTKTIYFGIRGLKNKIDGGKIQRTKRIQRKDIFHPYFWQRNLLDTEQTLQEAFTKIVHKLTGV